jgi:hypothetical protein
VAVVVVMVVVGSTGWSSSRAQWSEAVLWLSAGSSASSRAGVVLAVVVLRFVLVVVPDCLWQLPLRLRPSRHERANW